LAYALPYRRFAAVLTDCDARLGADMDRYSFIASDLHRLLVTGLPAHCERFCTSSLEAHKRVPKQIILDLNASDDPLHSLPRR